MATQKFRGQEATISVTQDGTSIPIGILDNPEVEVSKDISYLEGSGEITFRDLEQTSLRINVSGEIAAWDLDTWRTFVGYDSGADEIRTDAEVPTWTTEITYTDNNGDTAVFTVIECHSDSIPLGGARDEWIGMDLNFVGKTVNAVLANSTTDGSTA